MRVFFNEVLIPQPHDVIFYVLDNFPSIDEQVKALENAHVIYTELWMANINMLALNRWTAQCMGALWVLRWFQRKSKQNKGA